MAQQVEGTGYNGENDDNQTTEFEQWLKKHKVKPKWIKKLIENDYDSLYEKKNVPYQTYIYISSYTTYINTHKYIQRYFASNERKR